MPYEPGEDGHDEQGQLPTGLHSEERGTPRHPELPSPSTRHWCGPTHMGESQGVAPHSGEAGRTWRVLSEGLPRRGLRPSAHELCGVAEGPGVLCPSGVEDPGTIGVA